MPDPRVHLAGAKSGLPGDMPVIMWLAEERYEPSTDVFA